MTEMLDRVLARLRSGEAAAEARLAEVLRIPSVSADPAHAADCRRAAEWFAGTLREIGFAAEICPTGGHPAVLARRDGPPGAPRLLIYGHYDVQPAEPLDLWETPPFEPAFLDGPNGRRLRARGAVDDKGQCLTWLEALRAWHEEAGGPPVGVTVLVEGEEEVGSRHLGAFLEARREALAADLVVVSDTNMWDVATPAITTSLRGMAYVELRVRAASRDLHSGLFGGSALNPINALAHILGGLHDADGRIAIPGFYDGVAEPTPSRREAWAALGFSEQAFLAGVGLAHPAGERGRGALERLWARPTADVNGIWGGYQGPGSKTVIPAEAGAKISFRLVPGQDPEAVVAAFRRFVAERAPQGATAEVEAFSASPGLAIPEDRPWLEAARGALAAEYGRPAVLIGGGGSIPIVSDFARTLGLETLLMGFGLDDDQVHSPNEKFDLVCLHKGARSHARLLEALAAR